MDAALKVRSLPSLLVATTAALAVLGGLFAANIVRTGSGPAPALPDGPFGVSQDIPVSFGALAVENVAKSKGLTAKDLAGAVHGIGSLVKAGQTQVNLDVNLTNLLQDPVSYSPDQFTLHVGSRSSKAVLVKSTSLHDSSLQPAASISGDVAFVIPASRKRLWLAFDDPGRSKPVWVDLGDNAQAKKTPQSAFEHFFHHNH